MKTETLLMVIAVELALLTGLAVLREISARGYLKGSPGAAPQGH